MKKVIVLKLIVSMLILLAGIFPMPAYSSSAESMDINDFESTMSVGSSQTISVVLYPEDAEDTVKYSSSNISVATISQGGKISAKSAGMTNITITAESISQALQLSVEPVTIEVSDFESKMEVGGTQTIIVMLYPSGSNDKISYSSSNTSVATISQGGKIEAKSEGKTDITVSAGGAVKTMTLTVSVGTTGISLNSTYITLKRGQKYTLKAKVKPSSANQKLTYKSTDKSVAKVSEKGVVKAVGLGSASIIVSNGDLSTSCDVIVNSGTSGDGTMYFGNDSAEDKMEDMDTEDGDAGSVSPDRLKTFQKTGNSLTVKKKDYEIVLEGSDIVNTDNALSEELYITKNNDGYTFSVGGATAFLPGEVSIVFKNKDMQKCEYVYLLDKDSGKYKLFCEMEGDGYKTDIAGSYRITYEKLKDPGPNWIVISLAAAVILAIGGVWYILKKVLLL